MKNTMILLLALAGLLFGFISQFNACEKEKKVQMLQAKYDELYNSKTITDTLIVKDTAWLKQDTAWLPKLVIKEVPVTDSFYIDQPLMDRTYENTLSANNVEVKYKAIVRGWLLDLELQPIVETRYIHTQNIVTNVVPTWGSGFSVGGGGVIPQGWYVTAGYRKDRLTYRLSGLRIQKENMLMIGAEFNF